MVLRIMRGSVKPLSLALGIAVTVAFIFSSSALAQLETGEPVLFYDMAFRTPPSQVLDLSGSSNDGTLFGYDDPVSAYSEEESGTLTYVSFDGTGQHIWSNEQQLSPSEFTIEVEFRTTSTGGKIVGFEDKPIALGTFSDRLLYIDAAGLLRFGGASGISITVPSIAPVTDGEWHRAIAVASFVDSVVQYELFLDGETQGVTTGDSVSGYPGHWRIGSGNLSGWTESDGNNFQGDVQLVRIFEEPVTAPQPTPTPVATAVSPVEVTPLPVSIGPLVHLNPSVESDLPNTIVDVSGNLNTGTLYNFDDPAGAFHFESGSQVDRFIRFDGDNDMIGTATQMAALNDMTLVVWFRTSTPGGKVVGFENTISGDSSEVDRHLYVDEDGYLQFGGRYTSPTSLAIYRSREPVIDGKWHVAVVTMETSGTESHRRMYIDGQLNVSGTGALLAQYDGYWRLGGGDLSQWLKSSSDYFTGDIGQLIVYGKVLSPAEIASFSAGLSSVIPAATAPASSPTPADIPVSGEVEQAASLKIELSTDIEDDTLTLNISLLNQELFSLSNHDVWVVRENSDEFFVGPVAPVLTWNGDAVSGRYRVEVREASLSGDSQQVFASASVPVFAQPASAAQVAGAVAATVAVAGAVSAASVPGTWIYDFIWRFLRILVTEKVRRQTKKLDIHSIPSWAAAITAMVLMALLIAAGRPGALGITSFPQALVISTPAVIIYRVVTLFGGATLAYYTQQRPRYLIWAAGTASFAFTSLVLHSPFGYTGYLDKSPGDPGKDARFTAAGFAAILTLSGLFVMIGLLTKMSFAETGVTLTLGVLAVTMLPFPLMGGHNIWRWNRIAGVASGVIGLGPYIAFQLGMLNPTAVIVLATFGLMVFGTIMIIELWIVEDERLKESSTARQALVGP